MPRTHIFGARVVGSHAICSTDPRHHTEAPLGAGEDYVMFDGDRVASVGHRTGVRESPGDTVVDAHALAGPGAILTPGFVDIHCHGGAGAGYEDAGAPLQQIRDFHRAHGTTRAVLSLVSAPITELTSTVSALGSALKEHADILGLHIEGPFLDAAHRGAHHADYLRVPEVELIEQLIRAGQGTIRQVTLAPEYDAEYAAIRALTAASVTAAVGHTGATRDVAAQAFQAGARILTHAFNAMPGLHHREPGPIGAALADPRVYIELIADGVHVHPDLLRILFAAAPERIVLVTDAMAAAGMPDGDFMLGGQQVRVHQGVARLDDGGAIAGSTLTQDAALRTAVSAGVPLPQVVNALTRAPADALGRQDLGRLEPGALADAVLLDAALNVRAVWASGQVVSGQGAETQLWPCTDPSSGGARPLL